MTDNLYLQPTDRIREQIVTIAPNVRLEQTGTLLNLELHYSYEMYRFLIAPSANDRPDSHIGQLNGTLLPESAFNIGLYGDARLESIDRRRSDYIDSPTVNTTNRYLGRVRPTYRLRLGARQEIEAAYAYESSRTESSTSDDTDSQKGELAIIRRQTAHLDLRLEGFYEYFTARINPDYQRLQGMGGGVWRPFRTTTLTAMGGVTRFEYDSGESFNRQVVDVRLLYAPTRLWRLHASYAETFDDDIRDGLFQTWRGEAGISRSGPLGGGIRVFVSDNDYQQIDRDDRERGVAVEAGIQLSPRVMLGLNGDARRLRFEPVSERVYRYSAGAALTYTPRPFVALGCRYLYRNSDSDIGIHSYEENRSDCDIRLTYDVIP